MKKLLSYIGILVLTLFSFYYTDKASEIVRNNDPIMKNILANKDNYLIESVSATIDDDEVVSGLNGKGIDINTSYRNMKKHNIYDESMYVYKEIDPLLSFTNSYDKYIVGGNPKKNQLALVFKVVNSNYLDELNDIVLNKNVPVTLFVDGTILEENNDKILEFFENGNEIENLGYNSTYSKRKFIYTNNMINAITRLDPKYCYSDYKNSEVLEICSSNNMYTIKPTISVKNYPFSTIKNNVKAGNIISFNIDMETLKELPSIITYLRQKGYKLVILDELISEKYIDEK